MSTATTAVLERNVDRRSPPVANGQLAILAFIVFESMLFAGLLGGFSVLRFGSKLWPPPGQPYLPIALTWVNTAVLLGSLVPLTLAGRALRRDNARRFVSLLTFTALLGVLFLAIQGTEWVRLLAHGMKVVDGVYGGMFLMLIGTHGLHVLGAVVWLGVLALLAATGRLRSARLAVQMAATYWWFVCAVWVALFGVVYLA
jgi:cytochrome c oxidase subunit 3